MSVDKLVDSTQLETDLTSVANAIRTKGGTSSQLAFPSGFVSAINNIPTGGGGTPISADGITTVAESESVYPATGYNALINVSKKQTLIHDWDFTQGLVDSVGELTATLANGATQSSSGVLIGGATQYVQIPVPFTIRHTYEIDITSLSKQFSSGHGRIWDIASGEGFIAQNGTTLKYYLTQGTMAAWSAENGGTDLSILNGKTLTIKAGRITKCVTAGGNPVEYACLDNYIDGNFWFSTGIGHSSVTGNNQYMRIGESSASFYNAIVTGFRIYEGVNY